MVRVERALFICGITSSEHQPQGHDLIFSVAIIALKWIHFLLSRINPGLKSLVCCSVCFWQLIWEDPIRSVAWLMINILDMVAVVSRDDCGEWSINIQMYQFHWFIVTLGLPLMTYFCCWTWMHTVWWNCGAWWHRAHHQHSTWPCSPFKRNWSERAILARGALTEGERILIGTWP